MMKDEQSVRDAMTVILNRRSVRDYTEERVSAEAIEAILRAAMSAPTARNKQPWSFIVVTGRETLDKLREGLTYGRMLGTAGAAIVVCALPEEANLQLVELAVIDSSCASENMLLAAEALGLGAVWVAAWPYDDRMAFVRSTLHIPETVIPLNIIALGHPKESKPPVDKYRPEKVHREMW
jgi:nitroreductase